MNRLFLLPLLLTGLLVMVPASHSEIFTDFDFSGESVWQVGGFEVYDVMVRGEIVGEGKVEYSELTMMDAPAIRVEWLESWTDDAGVTTEVTYDVKQRADDMHVWMSTRTLKVGEEEWRFEGNYTGQNLQFVYYYPDEEEAQEASLSRSGRYHDMDILPFLLRNIIFEESNFFTLTVVDVANRSFMTPIARVTGSEIVETANTQYDCWVVNISLGMDSITAYYSKNEKHYLVKVRYSDREIVLNHHS